MGIASCYTCIKYLMFAFNFLFWLLGCIILGVGIWIRVDPNFRQYVDSTDQFNSVYVGAIVFMIIGAVIMVVGFLGCCGAIRESQCMLATFFIFLLLLFIAFVGIGAYLMVKLVYNKDKDDNELIRMLKDYVDNYDDPVKGHLMDNIQVNFKCCGYKNGFADYGGKNVPTSCLENKEYFPDGCGPKMIQYIEDHFVVIAGVAIGIAIIMILGMIFSMLLCCAIRDATA